MSIPEIIRFMLCALCTAAGLFSVLSGILGVFRFRGALSRMHAAALLDTTGLLFMLLGLMIAEGLTVTSLKLVCVILLLWIASPVSSHLIAGMEVTINDKLNDHLTNEAPDLVDRMKEGD